MPSRDDKNSRWYKKTAILGLSLALAMVLSYVETLIPINFGIPGIKLGLANLVVLAGLYRMKPGEVLLVSFARIMLIGFLFGNGMSIIYSLAGGLLSFLVMFFLIKTGSFSPVGVSAAGGVSHNIGQIIVAAAVLKSVKLFYYLPVLILSGVVTGVLMGILTGRVLKVITGDKKTM